MWDRGIELFQFERICEYFSRSRHHRKPLSLFFFTSHIFAQAYETKTFFNQITAWIAILILERNWIIINFVLYQSELSFLTKWHEIMKLVFRPDSLSSLLSYWSALDFWKIEFEKSSWTNLYFSLGILNMNFAGYTGNKNQIWNRQKLKFLQLSFSNLIFQTSIKHR